MNSFDHMMNCGDTLVIPIFRILPKLSNCWLAFSEICLDVGFLEPKISSHKLLRIKILMRITVALLTLWNGRLDIFNECVY